MNSIRIATRNSPLALWQANFVKDELQRAHEGLNVEIVGMTTKGDQMLDRSLAAVGGKGLFLKELEVSLLDKETDIAVHSMKDVPVIMPAGLEIAVVCEREDPRDAFVSNDYQNLYALPTGAKVGTSSLRRVSQLRSAFPNLEFAELRGNVNSRLAKLDNGEYDAIILAAAGLIRLGFERRIKQYISPELCLPAVGQGIVGIECRSEDQDTIDLLAPLHNLESALALAAERAMNEQLDGGCQVPVAGHAELSKGKIRMRGIVGEVDGSQVLFSSAVSHNSTVQSALTIGRDVGQDLLRQGAGDILKSVYDSSKSDEANRSAEQVKTDLEAESSKQDKPVVLLTRQTRYLGNMRAILNRLDYKPIHLPVIHVVPNEEPSVVQLIKNISDYTDIVFVSRNAVETGMVLIDQHSQWPDDMRVLAVGRETAKQLYMYGVDSMFPDQGSGAEALLKVKQLEDLSGRKVLIIRGQKGLDWPAEEMRKRGATVDNAVVYKQIMQARCASTLDEVFSENREVRGVFVHSAQSLFNLIVIAGSNLDKLFKITLVSGSQAIADEAIKQGWKGKVLVAESPSNKHMMITFSK